MQFKHLSCKDIAKITGEKIKVVRNWCSSGKLRASRPGGRDYVITEADFQEFMQDWEQQKMQPQHLSCKDIANMLGTSTRTVWSWCSSGKLRASRPGGRDYVITEADFLEFMQSDNRKKKPN